VVLYEVRLCFDLRYDISFYEENHSQRREPAKMGIVVHTIKNRFLIYLPVEHTLRSGEI